MTIYLLDSHTRIRKAVDRKGNVLEETRRVRDPETGDELLAPRKASRSYVVVDPLEVQAKLRSRGFDAEVLRFRSPWKAAVSVRLPGLLNGRACSEDPYVREVGFLLTNKGDAAILGEGSAVRLACMNQFPNPALRIRHTSQDARRFREDPAPFVWDLARFAEVALERIDSLCGLPGGWNLLGWTIESLRRLAEEERRARERKLGRKVPRRAPRLERTLLRAWEKYRRLDGPTVWALFQALSETRSPRLIRYVGEVFRDEDAYGAVAGGDVPLGISLN